MQNQYQLVTKYAKTSFGKTCETGEDVNTTTCAKQKIRKFELRCSVPQAWCVIFDSYPVWLCNLEKQFVSTIYFPQVKDWTDLRSKILKSNSSGLVSLYDAMVNSIGRSHFIFGKPSNEAIYLVLGNVATINKYLLHHNGLGILE